MKELKIKIISSIIFFIFIYMCIMLSNSSYVNKIFFDSKNKIDNPIINLYLNKQITIQEVNSETTFENLDFKVNNYNENFVNSAKMKYCIEVIDGLDDEFFEYIIINKKTNEEIKTENKKTKYIELMINEKEDIEYTLKINNKLPKNIEITDINLKVKIMAIQEK